MSTLIHRRVEAARAGTNPTVVCQVSSGWVVLGDIQFLRGYSLLLPDPVVPSLNSLTRQQRMTYLYEMTIIGDALLEVTDACRINYDILCNTEPALHAHVVPRYLSEPEDLRKGPPWEYFTRRINQVPFDLERDKDLMRQLAEAIQDQLSK
jgi:diadenosine tetraphosphate (Ap4A) HIT family hydrolase